MDYLSQNNLPQGFSIFQPAPGAQVQFFPALGSQELDALLHAYLPGSNSISDKRAAVTIDFFQQSQIDGQTFRFYHVEGYQAPVTATSSPLTTTSSPAQSYSSSQGSFPATPTWDFSNVADASTMRASKSSSKARKSPSASSSRSDMSNLPGMKIMTKDGLDVTNSASRGSKTKEQRDHAHLMRIIKACDSCRAKKVRCDPSHKRRSAASAAAPVATPSRPHTKRIAKSASRSPVNSQPSPIPASAIAVAHAPPTQELDSSLALLAGVPGLDSSMAIADDFVFDDALWNDFMASDAFSVPEQEYTNTADFGLNHNGLASTQASIASSLGTSESPGWGPYYSDLSQASSTQASSPVSANADSSDALARVPLRSDGTISPALLANPIVDGSSPDAVDASHSMVPRMDLQAALHDIADTHNSAWGDQVTGGESANATLQSTSSIHRDVDRADVSASGESHAGMLGHGVAANMPFGETAAAASTAGGVLAHVQDASRSPSAQRVLEDPGKPNLDGVDAQALKEGESSTAMAVLGSGVHRPVLEPVRDRQQQQTAEVASQEVNSDGVARSDTGADLVRLRGTEDTIAGLAPLSSTTVYLATTLLSQLAEVMLFSEATARAANSVRSPIKSGLTARKHARGRLAGGISMGPAIAVC